MSDRLTDVITTTITQGRRGTMEDTKWVKWEPKVGTVPPSGCEYWSPNWNWNTWMVGSNNRPLNKYDLTLFKFRIPALVEEVRPPWIEPQCKFRWGDRVKCGDDILYVIHPNDPTCPNHPVVAASSVYAAPPYSTTDTLYATGLWDSDATINGYREDILTMCSEDLPRHHDDSQAVVKKPLECWVVKSGVDEFSIWAHAKDAYKAVKSFPGFTIHHMREVLE